jgi:hypothetical protein
MARRGGTSESLQAAPAPSSTAAAQKTPSPASETARAPTGAPGQIVAGAEKPRMAGTAGLCASRTHATAAANGRSGPAASKRRRPPAPCGPPGPAAGKRAPAAPVAAVATRRPAAPVTAAASAARGPVTRPTEGPSTRDEARPHRAAEAPRGDEEDAGEALRQMRANEIVLVDTRKNFTFTMPKRARIAASGEQWAQTRLQAQDKLSNTYAAVASDTIVPPITLTLVDIQPVKADGGNGRFLTPEELAPRLAGLPRAARLGASSSFAAPRAPNPPNRAVGHEGHPGSRPGAPPGAQPVGEPRVQGPAGPAPLGTAGGVAGGARRGGAGAVQEHIFWVRDPVLNMARGMTIGTFAELYRTGAIAPIEMRSDSGWALVCDEDRVFTVPRHFLPLAPACRAAEPAPAGTPASAPAAAPPDAAPASARVDAPPAAVIDPAERPARVEPEAAGDPDAPAAAGVLAAPASIAVEAPARSARPSADPPQGEPCSAGTGGPCGEVPAAPAPPPPGRRASPGSA